MFKWVRLTEWKIASVGIACAVSSAFFAAHMISRSEDGYEVTPSENFGIFAQPSTTARNAPLMRFRPSDQTDVVRSIPSDPMPIGSILPRSGKDEGRETISREPAARQLPGFAIRGAFDGKVLVQSPNGFELVGPGDHLQDVGSVKSIKYEKGRWIVTTDAGNIEGVETN